MLIAPGTLAEDEQGAARGGKDCQCDVLLAEHIGAPFFG
jgi:hypothetical protein